MVMAKETGRLCSPAVGAVLRRCKALAMRWYLCGLSQLRRSGGPWFCCSLALSSYVLLPWSDPAFPQVVESDFSKNLAELSLAEDEAEAGYQKITQENKVTKAAKEQDVKYKEQESANLKKSASELTSDRDSANSELSAVVQYLAKLNDMCVAKAETYEEKVRRRTAEISGLKEALSILSESAFLQQHHTLHRVSVHQH